MFKSGASSLDVYESHHNYGLACHVVFRGKDAMLKSFTDRDRKKFFDGLKVIANQCGIYAAIDPQTYLIHLEMDICDLDHLQELHRGGGLHDVWEYLDSARKVPYGKGWIGDYKFYKCIELEGL